MGFYDCRCMISGVSLKADDAVLICLLQTHNSNPPEYVPVTLPMRGTYDRLGAIDEIQEDANTDLILRFFLKSLEVGEFVVDQEFLADKLVPGSNEFCYPIRKIQHLVIAFERNVNEFPTFALWEGQPVMFALISQEVWDALVRSPVAKASENDIQAKFERTFANSALAQGIYNEHLTVVARHLAEMSIVTDFLVEQGIAWRPEEDARQHYEEVRQFLTEARSTFQNTPAILAGLDAYEQKIRLLLDEG
jgi:hypothetical protein